MPPTTRQMIDLFNHEVSRWATMGSTELHRRLRKIRRPEKLACFLHMARAVRHTELERRVRGRAAGFGIQEEVDRLENNLHYSCDVTGEWLATIPVSSEDVAYPVGYDPIVDPYTQEYNLVAERNRLPQDAFDPSTVSAPPPLYDDMEAEAAMLDEFAKSLPERPIRVIRRRKKKRLPEGVRMLRKRKS